MKRHLFAAVAVAGLAANAQAFELDDVEILVGNLGPAGEALADGLANSVDAFASNANRNIEFTFGALGDTVQDSGSALVAGTSQDALSFALLAINLGLQDTAEPYLVFVDDPWRQPLDTVLNPEDVETIADNLQDVPEALLEGGDFSPGLRQAVINLLNGDIGEPGPLGPSGGAVVSAFSGLAEGLWTLSEGTNYAPAVDNTLLMVAIALIGAGVVFEAYDDPFGTIFDALEPATGPIIEVLEDA